MAILISNDQPENHGKITGRNESGNDLWATTDDGKVIA
jgi:hypothetical protein